MKVAITKEDIFHYVVGISCYDALERIIDPTKYDLRADYIWDKVNGTFIPQESDYVYYMKEVAKLKEFAVKMQTSEIRRLCEELQELSPKEINV
jgi:hypothetical protein